MHALEAGSQQRNPALGRFAFLYVQVLKRGWSVAETPYPKKVLHLPQVLSQEEVASDRRGRVSLFIASC